MKGMLKGVAALALASALFTTGAQAQTSMQFVKALEQIAGSANVSCFQVLGTAGVAFQRMFRPSLNLPKIHVTISGF